MIQLLPALEAGGVERSTLEVAAALVARGDRAVVVSAGGRLLPALQALGAEHVTLEIGRKSPLVLRHLGALRKLLAQADIVHARSRLPAWMAWLALRGLRGARPHFVTTAHGLNSVSRYSAIMTRGERVICVSNTVKAYWLQHYPNADPARFTVIPRGIDPALFPHALHPDTEARARLAQQYSQLGGQGPLLLLPGRGTRLKGHADAITLLEGLRERGIDARLWMLGARQRGREAYLQELQQQLQGKGLQDYALLAEPTSTMPQAYAASDLVLQLSRKPEAFGRTVIEALSVGRPVLGWAHGGVGELLAELLPKGAIPAFDQEQLAAAAQALLASPPSLPQAQPYTLRAMQEATLMLYDTLES